MKKTRLCPVASSCAGDLIAKLVDGEVEEWESDILEAYGQRIDEACYRISGGQTSIIRARQWLRVGIEASGLKCAKSKLVAAALTYSGEHHLLYRRLEAASVLQSIRNSFFYGYTPASSYFEGVCTSDVAVRKFLAITLLCGSLTRNRGSALFRSFFRSRMREVQLLPIVAKYVPLTTNDTADPVEGEEEPIHNDEEEREPVVACGARESLESLLDLARLLLLDTTQLQCLSVYLARDRHFVDLLSPLLLNSPSLERLQIQRYTGNISPTVSLGCFKNLEGCGIKSLIITGCILPSLSPLLQCTLGSLEELRVGDDQFVVGGLKNLKGLTSRNTKSLKKLYIRCADLEDISVLADCNLSSLQELSLFNCALSDISPLRSCDLSSLVIVNLSYSQVSDLSPLCECPGFKPTSLSFISCPVKRVSPFTLVNLSFLQTPISLRGSRVKFSHLSSLEKISSRGVVVDVTNTPASKKMTKRKLSSPQVFGKVTVKWW